MHPRLRNQLFYAAMAFFIAACYSAVLAAGIGYGLHARVKAHFDRARSGVRHARQRVTRAGATFLELLRSSV
jgi:hypothetical protein